MIIFVGGDFDRCSIFENGGLLRFSETMHVYRNNTTDNNTSSLLVLLLALTGATVMLDLGVLTNTGIQEFCI